jgi:hypothetical protein
MREWDRAQHQYLGNVGFGDGLLLPTIVVQGETRFH